MHGVSNWNPLSFLDRLFGPATTSVTPAPGTRVERLGWDSAFFGCGIYKVSQLSAEGFEKEWESEEVAFPEKRWNAFAEVPSEDTMAFIRLAKAGFALTETRLTYYHILKNLPEGGRKARLAAESDIPYLEKVASGAVNAFDKYHADPFFSSRETDRYLETYIGNCVKGFAEAVFVPDLAENPASFVALSRLKENRPGESRPFFRIPLTACLPANKGWHYDLCLQALGYSRGLGGACLVMTTQSTNRAVIHNCEKLGFKLGGTTHIFSKSST